MTISLMTKPSAAPRTVSSRNGASCVREAGTLSSMPYTPTGIARPAKSATMYFSTGLSTGMATVSPALSMRRRR